jgi:hypothetical protein
MEPTNQEEVPKLSQVIQIDEGKIQEHLGEVVRSTVEETLNAMLDAEADRLCPCRAVRTDRGAEGYPGGHLPMAVAHQSWRSHVESAEVAPCRLRRPSSNATGEGKAPWKKRW